MHHSEVGVASPAPHLPSTSLDDTEASSRPSLASVLVVDDDLGSCKILKRQCMKLGFYCDFVTNGMDACELVKQQDYAFILVDMQMPGMDGATLVHRIRQHFEGGRMPAIVGILSCDSPKMRCRCSEDGIYTVIVKPFDWLSLAVSLITVSGPGSACVPRLLAKINSHKSSLPRSASRDDLSCASCAETPSVRKPLGVAQGQDGSSPAVSPGLDLGTSDSLPSDGMLPFAIGL